MVSSSMEWPGGPAKPPELLRPGGQGRERQVAQHRAPAKRLQPGGPGSGPSEPTPVPPLFIHIVNVNMYYLLAYDCSY